MYTNDLTPAPASYQYTVGGTKGTSQVSFFIEGAHLKMSCTCRHRPPCWHAEYVLAGKTSRIVAGDTALQAELLHRAGDTIEGRPIVRKAKKRFAAETHCRRCNKERIVKIRSSLVARVLTIFKETSNHTYFCKDCKWTW